MLQGLVFTLITGLLWAAIGVAYSVMARRRMSFFTVMGPAFSITAALAWLVVPDHRVLASGAVERLGLLAAVMAGSGAITVCAMGCLQAAMRRGHHGACWAVGQSALVAPYLCGVLLFHEPLVWQRTLGVALILASLVAFGRARTEAIPGTRSTTNMSPESGGWFGLAIGALALLAVSQSLTTLPSHWDGWSDAAHLRVPLFFTGLGGGYAAAAVFAGTMPGKAELLVAASLVAMGLPSHFCLYQAMDCLKPVQMVGAVYPLAVGTCILGFALYSLLVLKEKTTTFHIAGLAVGLTGIVLLSL
jgi:multidrug transporter EmrE-like cation transporter